MKWIRTKLVILLYIICVGVFLGIFTYIFWLEQPLKTKRIVNEIIELKIDSCYSFSYDNKKHYEFFIGNKYKAVVDSIRFVPFEAKNEISFYVNDINSEFVISDWRRNWKSDIDKLLLHFRNYLLTRK